MDACIAKGINDDDSESASNSLSNGVAICENGMYMTEPTMVMELLTLLDLDVAYLSEKLVNLELYMTIVSLGEVRLGEFSMQNRNISEVDVEKALIFDLSFGYLDSEITELGCFLEVVQARMVDANQKICSFKQRDEVYTVTYTIFQRKLQASEDSSKHLEEQLSELKRQLTHFQDTVSFFCETTTAYSIGDEDLERASYDTQIAGQQRLVLKMLEKSLAAELNLEKQLLESRKQEEELKSKLLLKNEVVSSMEASMGVALERLLEAEHTSYVFKGIAKEMMSRLQIYEFNMHCSALRQEEMKSKLENRFEQKVKEKENTEHELKKLKKKLQDSESKLQELNAVYEASQEQLSEMEIATDSLREHAFIAETRADDAEEKLVTLTEENVELREEVGFLKADHSNEEKISLLEKQVRDLEVELKTSKSSAEASQEQQNMLYTAIWDMETLIEELNSKVSKSESNAENANKQYLALAETNLELSKEIAHLKSENMKLEESLKEAKKMKAARAKDVNNGAALITEMVMKLTIERERVQKQLSSLARENTILLEELRKMRKKLLGANQSNKEIDRKDHESAIDNPAIGTSPAPSLMEKVVETPTSATASNQVCEPSEANTDEAEAAGSSRFDDDAVAAAAAAKLINHDEAEAADTFRHDDDIVADNCTKHENANHEDPGTMKNKQISKKSCILTAVFVLLLSILAMNINWQYIYLSMRRQYLDFQ